MGVIWYAIGIYVVGIAVMLFVRPSFMFRPGGTWKEFGLSSDENYTAFPFWVFAIIWALTSYALATVFHIFFLTTVMQSSDIDIVSPDSSFMQPVSLTAAASQAQAASQEANTAVASALAKFAGLAGLASASAANSGAAAVAAPATTLQTKPPGYYILETINSEPRYVYWGPEPPTAANMIVR
jgi:hypothetical protein